MKKIILALLATCCMATHAMDKPSSDTSKCLYACKTGNLAEVERFLNSGISVNTVLEAPVVPEAFEQTTFLHWSTKHPYVLTLLLNRGAHVNAQDEESRTALHNALYQTSLESVRVLLSRDASLKIYDSLNETHLHHIARNVAFGFILERSSASEKSRSSCQIIELFKERGVNISAVSTLMNTAFHLIAQTDCHDVAISLLTPYRTHEEKATSRAQSRNRLKTFLCCLKRINADLPNEIITQIFSNCPIDCKQVGLDNFISSTSKETLAIDFLNNELTPLEREELKHTLSQLNNDNKTAAELATDIYMQQLLQPDTWN